MRCPATPAEVARWRQQLAPLQEHRQLAVIKMLARALDDCPICDGAVRRCDPRRLVDDRLVHLDCSSRRTP